MVFIFNSQAENIIVPAPTTQVTIQELYNAIQNWQAFLPNLTNNANHRGTIVVATGKDYLGGGLYTGITLTLHGWKLGFEARPGPTTVLCEVRGGNLLAQDHDENYVNPIHPTAYTQVVISVAVSATIKEVEVPAPPPAVEALTLPQLIAWDLSRE